MKKYIALVALLVSGFVITSCVKDEVAPPPPPTDAELFLYWHFNNLPEGDLTEMQIMADFSKVGTAHITYPGTGDGYLDQYGTGADLNTRNNEIAGLALRPRNPANTRELLFVAPSTGYHSLVVSYAVHRSSNGAAQNEFYYSADGGTNWVMVGEAIDVPLDYELVTIDLSEIEAVNDNANLRFRILFVGAGADGSSGNNRYDNITVDGIPLN